MAMTICEVFANMGYPMDSRIRQDFGFADREPARASYRQHPDGFLEGKLSTDAYWQSEIPDAPAPYRHPSPSEKPRGSNVESRLKFKKADRAVKVAFNRPPVGPIVERPRAHVFIPKAQPKAEGQAQPDNRIRKHMLVERQKLRLRFSLDQACEVFNLFGSWDAFLLAAK